VDRARNIADDILFPAAAAIDRSAVLPRRYLDELAGAGLYGLFGPRSAGGLDADPISAARVVEALGGGSLTTAFVWIQHHSPVRAITAAAPSLRERWLADLCSGRVRAGIAYAALRRPGPPSAVARRSADGSAWILDGYAPWVTGWGLVDVVLVGARAGADVVWLLVNAGPGPTQAVRPVELAALQASATVELRWTAHPVDASRVVGVEAFDDWARRDAYGGHLNGYLAVGVATRCCRLLGPSALDGEVALARRALDEASPAAVVPARARASLLAVRAATALVAAGGGRSVESGHDAARLMGEAMFLLVFGQTRDIRSAQLADLGAAAPPPRPPSV
jgi:alkylation response protein AidB-like acyl-CoA dehydrogenase